MNSEALERLEFNRFRDIVGEYLATPAGKEALSSAGPLAPGLARRELALLQRAMTLLQNGVSPPLSEVPDVRRTLEKAARGSLLTGVEFLDISGFLLAGAKIHDATEELGVVPDPYFLVPLAQEIRASFSPEGELLDAASPELRRIRRAKRKQRARVLSLMESVAEKHRDELRDEGITIRAGRFVLGFASHVKAQGVVHGYSRTTQTQFVEPLEVVEEQNRLVRLAEEEAEEIQAILTSLSSRVRRNAGFLRDLWAGIGRADLLWAKARYAQDTGACVPRILDEKGIVLKGARHPVLLRVKGPQETVPLDLRTGPYVKSFLFTGPNAGGKTVAMTTVALALLAGASGFPFPAEEIRVWVPTKFFALGFQEEGSIEQGLSSFTGLLEEIKTLLLEGNEHSVAFFDEVLSSTDPGEGGALAFALLKGLSDRGVQSFSTTHLTVLKNLAVQEEGFVVAAAETDARGVPTYRFKMGAVGGSHAIKAAARAGLPPDVLAIAEAAMRGYEENMARIRRELERKEQKLKRVLAEQRQIKEDTAAREKEILDRARTEAKRIISEARKRVEDMLREIKTEANAERRLRAAKKIRKSLRAEEISLDKAFSRRVERPVVGKSYRVSPMGFVGELVELRGQKALLRVGNSKVEVALSALYEV